MRIVEWFHHLFNPHCEHCTPRVKCQSCENLKEQLYYMQNLVANLEFLLTKAITHAHTDPATLNSPIAEIPQPLQTRHVPFRIKREALEAEARETARILRERQGEIRKAGIKVNIPTHPFQSTEDLEKELGIIEEEKEG